jgi:hypothetical protein
MISLRSFPEDIWNIVLKQVTTASAVFANYSPLIVTFFAIDLQNT